MITMKKLIPLAALALMTITAHAAPLKVVATVPDLGDIATKVCGSGAEVYTMASGLEDPHNVLMKPSMISKLQQADLFIVMGLDLEHAYAPALLAESRNQKIQLGKLGYLDCSKGISVRDVPKSLDRAEGEQHPIGNPHYNLDPGRMKVVAGEIADRMGQLDSANAATYKANAKAFGAQLEAKFAGWRAKLGGKNIKFVSYHPDMVYFAERFGLTHVGTIQPKPGVEPGPRYIEELISKMKQEGVTLIVKESFYSDRLPSQIAKATGAKLVSVPIMVHGTKAAADYISFIDTLVNAFSGM
jgi:ABC-type Zn uptake system ZnuABC Zn-binding protein ZnuA